MNYLGKFVTGFKDFYDQINPSNMTGAIDVLVVKHEQEGIVTYKASPFHVKFGKYDVFRPKEKRVDISVNGKPVKLTMRLGKAGAAYFCRGSVFDCDCTKCLSGRKRLERSLNHLDISKNKDDSNLDVFSEPDLHSYQREEERGFRSEGDIYPDSKEETNVLSQWSWGELPTTEKYKEYSYNALQETIIKRSLLPLLEESRKKQINPLNCFIDNIASLEATPVIEATSLLNLPVDNEEAETVCDEKIDQSDGHPMTFRVSLCGNLNSSRKKPLKFDELILTHEILAAKPTIIYDPHVVVEVDGRYYDWITAAPLIVSYFLFQRRLPKKRGASWFAWKKSSLSTHERLTSDDDCEVRIKTSMAQEELLDQNSRRIENIKCKRRVLKLESDDLATLGLLDGTNDITFSVTTKLQGTVTIKCNIYLWDRNDKIVISDIDGTITKSDVLGHMMHFVGKDWNHTGVTKVLNTIQSRGYRIMYLSSRTIGIAGMTRSFLKKVNTDQIPLPCGPVLLSPSSLLKAIHTEIIIKKPELFKIGCLADILTLFPIGTMPYWAGFGNRDNDAIAYQAVGVDSSRIFIVNPNGAIKNLSFKFNSLSLYADHIFPRVNDSTSLNTLNREEKIREYGDLNFWETPFLQFHEEESSTVDNATHSSPIKNVQPPPSPPQP